MTLKDFRSSLNRGAPSPGAHTALMLIWPICGDARFGSEPGFDFALQCPVSVLVRTYYIVSISIPIETFDLSVLSRNLLHSFDFDRNSSRFRSWFGTYAQFRQREKKTPNFQCSNSNKGRRKS